jgi:hypothetical protein
MTRDEAKKAVDNNSMVYYVVAKDHRNKRWLVKSSWARSYETIGMIMDLPHRYHYDPKDAVIEWCMSDIEHLTRQISECKLSVLWPTDLVK